LLKLLVLAGPTASGKSELALALSRKVGGEIVNGDSQQIYRGLDAGTAKPTIAERAEVPHHLVDVVDPGEGMDALRYQALADRAIADIAGRGALPIVVGGTGLYLRVLLHGVVPAPGRNPVLRAAMEAQARQFGRAALHRRLAALDPVAAAKIGENDLVRVIRALEIAAGGRTQTELFAQHRFRESRYLARLLAIDRPRPELHARIRERLPRLFAGLLAETALLLARCGGVLPPRLPIGYAEASEVLAGRLDREEALRRVEVAHRRYARRQVIWLRKEPGTEWIRPPWDLSSLSWSVAAWFRHRQ